MKIRTDFVTNSSSANFMVRLQLKSDQDEMVSFSVSTGRDSDYDGEGAYYDGSNPYAALFDQGWPVNRLRLYTPYPRDKGITVGGKPISQAESLERVIQWMIDMIGVGLYDDEIVADGMNFFIVGDPLHYDDYKDLAETIERLGGSVTGPEKATYVIYCGKERFCKRWPEGYSYQSMDEAERTELDSAEASICEEMADESAEFYFYYLDESSLSLYTGACDKSRPNTKPSGWEGWSIQLDDRKDAIPILSEREFAFFDPDGPAGHGTLSTMPGAVEALAKKCAAKGITQDNLRIIGAKIMVTPFGDSVWEVDDYVDQWDINVQKGELRSTGKVVTRWAGSLEGRGDIWDVDTSWQDTVWWPFEGKVKGTPYASVMSGAVDRATVRHLDLSEFAGTRITKMKSGFDGFEDLQDLDLSALDISQVTDMTRAFSGCRELRSLDLSALDTSQVNNMGSMFSDCTNLRKINLSGLDTSQVTNMSRLFSYCEQLRSIDLSSFNTSRVTYMTSMFNHCEALESLNVSRFDTSQVLGMAEMFHACGALQSLNLSNFDTSHVTDMMMMFMGCANLRKLDISNFDTSQVTDMSYLFWDCEKLKSLDVSGFDTSKVTNMRGMFGFCEGVKRLDVSSFDTSLVTSMKEMFKGCESLKELDLSGFDTSQVTNMEDMFEGCKSLQNWSVSASWPVDKDGAIPPPRHNGAWWSKRDGAWLNPKKIRERGPVADTYTATRPLLAGLPFLQSSHPDAVPYAQVVAGNVDIKTVRHIDFSGYDTSQLTSMRSMFERHEQLREADLSGFDTSQVTDMCSMFESCYWLEHLDLSSFDTSRVTNMFNMFDNCLHLKSLNLSSFDTSHVTTMGGMFKNCSDLTSLDLSNFDTSSVTNMFAMFDQCSRLESVNLSGFDTSKVTDMASMFYHCWNLKSLDLSGFDASQVTDTRWMFKDCHDLERWVVSETWPVGLEGAIPQPTADNGKWWSERAGAWMTVDEIRQRGPMADTYTNAAPDEAGSR